MGLFDWLFRQRAATEREIGPPRGFPVTPAVAEGGGEKLSRVEFFFLSKFEKPIKPDRVSDYLKATTQQDTTKTSANGNSSNKEQLKPYYTACAASMPVAFASFPFEQWASFFTNWDLATVDGDLGRLTVAGKTIIPYMQSWGYLNVRPVG